MEKRGRAMDANESFAILQNTAGKHLVSWFDPFYSQMVDAVEKRKTTTILGGVNFNIRRYGNDVVFMKVDGFVPMTRIGIDRLVYLMERNSRAIESSK